MIREIQCKDCNKIEEKLFLGINDAAEINEYCTYNRCMHCGGNLYCVEFSITALPLAFYGSPEGYHKSAPSKRWSTKTIRKDKGNYK